MNDRRVDEVSGERCRFASSILMPWCRKSPRVSEVLPLLYLHGMSSGDFAPALSEFFGSAAGLSASVVTRLTVQWQDEHALDGVPTAFHPPSMRTHPCRLKSEEPTKRGAIVGSQTHPAGTARRGH